MRDPFAGYDAWLERPYQDAIDDSDAFYEWAEGEGYNLEDDDDMMDAEHAYQDYLEGLEEDRMLAAYEDKMERDMDNYYERNDY